MEKKKRKTHADPCISATDRYGGGASLMVWGGILGWQRTDLVVIQGNLNGVCMAQGRNPATSGAIHAKPSRGRDVSTRVVKLLLLLLLHIFKQPITITITITSYI